MSTSVHNRFHRIEWLARVAVAIVFAWNVLCALQFIFQPVEYAQGSGLAGTPTDQAVISGLGVAFLMWNATYPLVIAQPSKHRTLFAVVLAQQAIGLVGESAILARLFAQGADGLAVVGSIQRFIAFDAAGLVIMGISFVLLMRAKKRIVSDEETC